MNIHSATQPKEWEEEEIEEKGSRKKEKRRRNRSSGSVGHDDRYKREREGLRASSENLEADWVGLSHLVGARSQLGRHWSQLGGP